MCISNKQPIVKLLEIVKKEKKQQELKTVLGTIWAKLILKIIVVRNLLGAFWSFSIQFN